MRSALRTYKCVQCFRRFKTHADLQEAKRVCPVCVVVFYKPPPAPVRPPLEPTAGALTRRKLTREEYDRIFDEQEGLCAICRRQGWEYVIDHNHETGKVRGLLCHGCNTALGIFGDCPETLARAAAYLTERGHYAGFAARATRGTA